MQKRHLRSFHGAPDLRWPSPPTAAMQPWMAVLRRQCLDMWTVSVTANIASRGARPSTCRFSADEILEPINTWFLRVRPTPKTRDHLTCRQAPRGPRGLVLLDHRRGVAARG